jgi:hypothetical protein
VDDYHKEIADLEAQVEQLVEADGDAKTIVELTMQLEIKAIYSRTTDLQPRPEGREFAVRAEDPGLW